MTGPIHLARKVLYSLGRRVESIKSKNISDEYILRLTQINSGMLNHGNLHCLDYAIGHLPTDSPILEIGPFCGLSTNIITYYREKHRVSNKLITCDRWDYSFKGLGDSLIGNSSIKGTEWGKFAKETFMHNVSFFSRYDLPYGIELWSDDFFSSWSNNDTVQDIFGRPIVLGGKISLCFIDGNHEYGHVCRDFENSSRFLDKDGYILFDDSANFSGSPGVKKLMRELLRSKVIGSCYELVMRNPNCLIRKLR